jgi:hypothetical protein
MVSWFARAFGAAVSDMRQRLVEEAWFGRIVTPRRFAEFGSSKGEPSPAERLGWDRPGAGEPMRNAATDQERGIDR